MAWPAPRLVVTSGTLNGPSIEDGMGTCSAPVAKIASGRMSPDSIRLIEKVMGFIRKESWKASLNLGAEKGVFPELEPNREAYAKFLYDEIGISRETPLTPRNYEVTTIAPTGTTRLGSPRRSRGSPRRARPSPS